MSFEKESSSSSSYTSGSYSSYTDDETERKDDGITEVLVPTKNNGRVGQMLGKGIIDHGIIIPGQEDDIQQATSREKLDTDSFQMNPYYNSIGNEATLSSVTSSATTSVSSSYSGTSSSSASTSITSIDKLQNYNSHNDQSKLEEMTEKAENELKGNINGMKVENKNIVTQTTDIQSSEGVEILQARKYANGKEKLELRKVKITGQNTSGEAKIELKKVKKIAQDTEELSIRRVESLKIEQMIDGEVELELDLDSEKVKEAVHVHNFLTSDELETLTTEQNKHEKIESDKRKEIEQVHDVFTSGKVEILKTERKVNGEVGIQIEKEKEIVKDHNEQSPRRTGSLEQMVNDSEEIKLEKPNATEHINNNLSPGSVENLRPEQERNDQREINVIVQADKILGSRSDETLKPEQNTNGEVEKELEKEKEIARDSNVKEKMEMKKEKMKKNVKEELENERKSTDDSIGLSARRIKCLTTEKYIEGKEEIEEKKEKTTMHVNKDLSTNRVVNLKTQQHMNSQDVIELDEVKKIVKGRNNLSLTRVGGLKVRKNVKDDSKTVLKKAKEITQDKHKNSLGRVKNEKMEHNMNGKEEVKSRKTKLRAYANNILSHGKVEILKSEQNVNNQDKTNVEKAKLTAEAILRSSSKLQTVPHNEQDQHDLNANGVEKARDHLKGIAKTILKIRGEDNGVENNTKKNKSGGGVNKERKEGIGQISSVESKYTGVQVSMASDEQGRSKYGGGGKVHVTERYSGINVNQPEQNKNTKGIIKDKVLSSVKEKTKLDRSETKKNQINSNEDVKGIGGRNVLVKSAHVKDCEVQKRRKEEDKMEVYAKIRLFLDDGKGRRLPPFGMTPSFNKQLEKTKMKQEKAKLREIVYDSSLRGLSAHANDLKLKENAKTPWWDVKNSQDYVSGMSDLSKISLRSNTWVNQSPPKHISTKRIKYKGLENITNNEDDMRLPNSNELWWNNKEKREEKRSLPIISGLHNKWFEYGNENDSKIINGNNRSTLHSYAAKYAQNQKEKEEFEDRKTNEEISNRDNKENKFQKEEAEQTDLVRPTSSQKTEDSNKSDESSFTTFADIYALIGKDKVNGVKREINQKEGKQDLKETTKKDPEKGVQGEEDQKKTTKEFIDDVMEEKSEPNLSKYSGPVTFRIKYPDMLYPIEPRPTDQILIENSKHYGEFEVKFIPSKPQLVELITAAKSSSMSRRSNACGTLKVMASQKKNALILPRSTGVLDALVFVIGQKIELDDTDGLTARSRAASILFLISQPKENRRIICQHAKLVENLVFAMKDDVGDVRTQACSIIATLAKSEENRHVLADMKDLVTTLSIILRGISDEKVDEIEFELGTKYNKEKFEETVAQARLNSCAALSHISKQCSISKVLCESNTFLGSISEVCLESDNVIHTRCLEMLCSLTRLPSNNATLSLRNDIVDALVRGGSSKIEDDRIWSIRAIQNITADSSCKEIVSTPPILELLTKAAKQEGDEQEAAIASMLNLSTDSDVVLKLMNIKNIITTLAQIANCGRIKQEICIMSSEILAMMALYLQSAASTGLVPEGATVRPLPTLLCTGWLRWN